MISGDLIDVRRGRRNVFIPFLCRIFLCGLGGGTKCISTDDNSFNKDPQNRITSGWVPGAQFQRWRFRITIKKWIAASMSNVL